MESIAVPTPGCWNINDIYTPKANVVEGKVVRGADGKFTLSHALQSPTNKRNMLFVFPFVKTPPAEAIRGWRFDGFCAHTAQSS